jgi:hypothetical protein
MSEEGSYTVYGISGIYIILNLNINKGAKNIFGIPYCENDRLWRRMLAITPDRYHRSKDWTFDECNNAYVKPKNPVYLDLLNNLHKKSDYEQ